MKFRKTLAAVLLIALMGTLAGCNYISRPKGAANNGEDISGKLSSLLTIPVYNYAAPTHKTEDVTVPGDETTETPTNEEPTDETPVEETPVYTPFTSTFDPQALLSKIDALVKTMKAARGTANSATGVSDELLANRSVKILVPDTFPISEEDAAVQAISSQYGCAVNVKRMGTGAAYAAACRRAVLSGDKVDLMYVDNASWGDLHTYTQAINTFVNFSLGDKLGTFSSAYSKRFYVKDDLDDTLIHYYVAAGMGAPYLLAYNKGNIKNTTLAESATSDGTTLRSVNVVDPVTMYNNRSWGIDAFTALLQSSTTGSNVGLASVIDQLSGLDIWYGMENVAGFSISSATGKATVNLTPANNATVDVVQNWYWNTKGSDAKNFVGSLVNASAWSNGTVYQKLFNRYSGADSVKSYSFVACELTNLKAISEAAESMGANWDFVAYPYGQTYENMYRTMTETDFNAKVEADKQLMAGEEKGIVTPAAGWVGGFAVMKTCQNPSVALRVAEEYTKVWKAEFETPYYNLMTTEQQARYNDMKSNIGVSFVRSWVEKAINTNVAYPDAAKYFYGYATTGGSITSEDPDYYTTDRSNYVALSFFDNNPALATQPIYHKNDALGFYSPQIQKSWSAYMDGSPSATSASAKDTGSVIDILNATLLPSNVLFNW